MKICYLPVKDLKANSDNFLPPLSVEEYEELRQSIMQHGILEPLIVVPEEKGIHTIISGNHRYKIALELGMKELLCIIVDKIMVEGAFDTEIFRRHLNDKQKEEFKIIKEKICKDIIDKALKKGLLPELYELYKQGKLDREIALKIMGVSRENQVCLIQLHDDSDKIVLGETLLKKDAQIKKMKEEKRKLNRKIEEYEEEIKKMKLLLEKAEENIDKAMCEEFQKELDRREEIREGLVKQLKEKEKEIEAIKDQEKKSMEAEKAEILENKTKEILLLEKQKKYMVNIVLYQLNSVSEQVAEIRKKIKENEMPIKDASIAREKIKNLIESLREMLSLIKIAPSIRNGECDPDIENEEAILPPS